MHWINWPLVRAKVDWQVSWRSGGKKWYQLPCKILGKIIMTKGCNGVTEYTLNLVWCYGETHMVQWCREYKQVHMVKWWNIVMKRCNNKGLHLIMVKWCNKYDEMVQRIHTSSHGEMVKRTSGYILYAKWAAPTPFDAVSPCWFW